MCPSAGLDVRYKKETCAASGFCSHCQCLFLFERWSMGWTANISPHGLQITRFTISQLWFWYPMISQFSWGENLKIAGSAAFWDLHRGLVKLTMSDENMVCGDPYGYPSKQVKSCFWGWCIWSWYFVYISRLFWYQGEPFNFRVEVLAILAQFILMTFEYFWYDGITPWEFDIEHELTWSWKRHPFIKHEF